MNNFESQTPKDIEKNLNTDFKKGLTQDEVNQRLAKNGRNELPAGKVRPWYVTFLLALIEPLQLILLAAAVISVVAPRIGNWNAPIIVEDFIDFVVIVLIVIVDAVLETVQTVKARKSVDALKSLSKPKTVVLRDGAQKEIDAAELVVGDIVILEAGKYVPAELRIIESSEFMIDESILTGESVPVEKTHKAQSETLILAEMKNIAFMSTFTTAGRAIGVVIKTATDTEIGKIATTVNANVHQQTPLEKKLSSFSYWISAIAALIGVLIFTSMFFTGERQVWAEYLMIAITLAIGVIPESLSAVVSITLSFSTKRMTKENVIVKKLASVETLGSVNVICTDKTGTLTQNKMTVKRVILNNTTITSEEYVKSLLDEQKDLFLKSLVLPNDSVTEDSERLGDPTELALVDFAELMNIDEQKARIDWNRIDEIPFDSERKLMTTVNNISGTNTVFTKGAIDQLLNICDRIMLNNKIVKLTKDHKNQLLEEAKKLSNDALRVLAFAYNENYDDVDSNGELEKSLIFLGAVAMIDPVRNEAVQAISEAHAAGIGVVMITGDHATTALAIARDLDLAYTSYEVISSEVLEKMTDDELGRIIDNISVFARVNPEHKVRIVSALQAKGYIVSMTGDGVNDAPSLSKADIGVAMGITGTDVAKQASDVILTDDNFATIMKGVNEGRNVYQKIKRAIVLLMGFNLANVLTIFILSLLIHVSPLEATNILYINLIVESCLAIAIGMGPLDPTLMMLPPKTGKNKLLNGLIWPIIKIGIATSIAGIGSFFIGMTFTPDSLLHGLSWYDLLTSTEISTLVKEEGIVYGRTSLFITTVFAALFFAHTIKLSNWRVSRKVNLLISPTLIYASFIAGAMNLILILVPGINSSIFGLMNYGAEGWNASNVGLFFIAFALSFIPTILILIFDAITFYSYHWAPKSWQRNRHLVSTMVEEDRKKELAKVKRKRKQYR
ncbi:cation-transporting ATPase [Williamsoniiplasma somnilux]|uniref:Cation-transporting ATPase n=1 Tax=Williamsoniiplasma somnilux TaxID=215578 RepID=A0A2K8P189_9MOLU|nr:cation-translocating P-type ATPase [Williamsoniiplasma somnilux]ATZ18771.1 cation-transporting ATPase [Williamsoniiplasma somnilux]